MKTVLVIDDDDLFQALMRVFLQDEYRVVSASNTADGESLMINEAVDCIILDYNMPDESGFVFLHRMYQSLGKKNLTPIIFVSGALTYAVKQNTIALGAKAALDKGDIDQKKLLALIERITTEPAPLSAALSVNAS